MSKKKFNVTIMTIDEYREDPARRIAYDEGNLWCYSIDGIQEILDDREEEDNPNETEEFALVGDRFYELEY